MKDGLYKVAFETPLGCGTGVVVLNNGKLSGGDANISYLGQYQENGDKFSANVKTARHSEGAQNVFGRDAVTIVLNGTIIGDSAQMVGSAPEAPGIKFKAHLKLLAAA
jgi:hypothetical protein